MLSELTLTVISDDFYKVSAALKQVANGILKNGKEPIFIMSFSSLSDTFPLVLDYRDLNNDAYYYVSYIDGLHLMHIIDKINEFRMHYKDPKQWCCILYIDLKNNFNDFIYTPYEKKSSNDMCDGECV